MSLSDRLDEADDFADAWVPKPGDKLVGIISAFSKRTTDYGEYMIVTVKQPDGQRLAVHAFHYVLEQELNKYKLREGVEIGVKYLGKPEGKNYEMYKVVSDAELKLVGEGEVGSDVPSDGFAPVSSEPVPTPVAGADDDIPF